MLNGIRTYGKYLTIGLLIGYLTSFTPALMFKVIHLLSHIKNGEHLHFFTDHHQADSQMDHHHEFIPDAKRLVASGDPIPLCKLSKQNQLPLLPQVFLQDQQKPFYNFSTSLSKSYLLPHYSNPARLTPSPPPKPQTRSFG